MPKRGRGAKKVTENSSLFPPNKRQRAHDNPSEQLLGIAIAEPNNLIYDQRYLAAKRPHAMIFVSWHLLTQFTAICPLSWQSFPFRSVLGTPRVGLAVHRIIIEPTLPVAPHRPRVHVRWINWRMLRSIPETSMPELVTCDTDVYRQTACTAHEGSYSAVIVLLSSHHLNRTCPQVDCLLDTPRESRIVI
jgi:hypothetical protein